MAQAELIDILKVENELGEGIIWDAESGSAWWTDIENCLIYRYQLKSKQLQSWPTPERLACFALVSGENYLIAGFESGFAYFEPESGYIDWLHKIEKDKPDTRLNDGRADRQGRFWSGSMVENNANDVGTLYCLDNSLNCIETISGLSISNALCWSPDSTYLYHADTPTNKINRYDFNNHTAELSNPAVFAQTDSDIFPDGSTVDADGYVWNAQWGGSRVVRYTPNGEIDLIVPTPATQPSCAAFGGSELNILFVTSAKQGLDQQQLQKDSEAGNIFIYQTDVTGIIDSKFKPNT